MWKLQSWQIHWMKGEQNKKWGGGSVLLQAVGFAKAYGLPLWLSWWRIRLQWGRLGFYPWIGTIPSRKGQLPTPVFLPGEFHGLYGPWGHRVRHNWETFISFVRVSWASLQFSSVAQSCLTLCDPMDYIVCGILQVRILEWVAFPFSRGSSQPRDQKQVSCIAGGFFTSWATRDAQFSLIATCKWKTIKLAKMITFPSGNDVVKWALLDVTLKMCTPFKPSVLLWGVEPTE